MGRLLSRLGGVTSRSNAPSKPVLVAANCWQPTFRYRDTTNNWTTYDTQHFVRLGKEAIGEVRIGLCGFYESDNGAGEADLGNDYTVEASLQIPPPYSGAAPAYQPFLFNGQKTVTVVNGTALLMSDPIMVNYQGSAPGAITGLTIRLSYKVANSALYVPAGSVPRNLDTGYASTSAATQAFSTTAMSTPAGGSTISPIFMPHGIYATPANPLVAVHLSGDSFGEGTGDTPDSTNGLQGWLQRGLNLVNGVPIPSFNASKGASRVRPQRIFNPRNKRPMGHCTHVISARLRNDLAVGVGLADLQLALVEHWAACKAVKSPYGRPMYVVQTLAPPSTNSTDGWATAANQNFTTPVNLSMFAPGGVRDQINAWIRTQVGVVNATHGIVLLDEVIDPNPAWEDPSNPGKWLVSGTVDGVHPTNPLTVAAGLILNAAAAKWQP